MTSLDKTRIAAYTVLVCYAATYLVSIIVSYTWNVNRWAAEELLELITVGAAFIVYSVMRHFGVTYTK